MVMPGGPAFYDIPMRWREHHLSPSSKGVMMAWAALGVRYCPPRHRRLPGKEWHSKALSERSAAYDRAMELRGRGLALGEISRELGVGKDTVGAWCRGAKPSRIWRYDPDLAPSGDLAYLAGFCLGDGKYAGEEHKVRFELAEREQMEYVGGIVAKILGREPKPLRRDGTFYTVDYDSVALSNFLDQDVEALVDYLKGLARDFLRGFFDAEGMSAPGFFSDPNNSPQS